MNSRSEVVFIGGGAGVGKTSVATELHAQLAAVRIQHCLIDGDNLDLAWPAPHERGLRLAEKHLTFMWRSYQAAGYSRLIYANTAAVHGPVLASLLEALGGDLVVHAVLLRADATTVAHRLAQREIGSSLEVHLARSEASRQALDSTAPSWVLRIDTDGRTVPDVASQIAIELCWSPQRQ